ncbi:hypothetical protein YC2023_105481 [Brassica napus]
MLNSKLEIGHEIELPAWTDIVKTGKLKELAPYDPDWYYIRAASMARKVYLRGGLGVGAFRRIYGGSKRNGSRPPHFCKSSGGVARHILQQLQTMNIVDLDTKGLVVLSLSLREGRSHRVVREILTKSQGGSQLKQSKSKIIITMVYCHFQTSRYLSLSDWRAFNLLTW